WWRAEKREDSVLPATTTIERNDIQASELSRFYIAMYKAVPPFANSKNDLDIFAELADRLGFGGSYMEGRDEMGWLAHMYEGARQRARDLGYSPPSFDAFWEAGSYEFPAPNECTCFLGAFRRDP